MRHPGLFSFPAVGFQFMFGCLVHLCFQSALSLFLHEHQILASLPEPDGPVLAAGVQLGALLGHIQAPHGAPVTGKQQHLLKSVCIPVFNGPIFARAEEIVSGGLELHTRHTVLVGQQRAVAVTEVQTPDLHGLVSTAGDKKSAVVRDVEAHYRQLVTVQGQKEAQTVLVVDAHRAVEQTHCDHQPVLTLGGGVLKTKHVMRHLQLLAVHRAETRSGHRKVPEGHLLIGTSGHEPFPIRTDGDGPQGTVTRRGRNVITEHIGGGLGVGLGSAGQLLRMRRSGVKHTLSRGRVEYLHCSFFRACDNVPTSGSEG
mmetsp:Transcript_60910/g.107005  ORF Transcript_60910/g.107005 Transcript_60910/m.107005 type:complete len:313 (-) Transcript_60910:1457-2395(-)